MHIIGNMQYFSATKFHLSAEVDDRRIVRLNSEIFASVPFAGVVISGPQRMQSVTTLRRIVPVRGFDKSSLGPLKPIV